LPRELLLFADQLTSLHCAHQPLSNENALLSRLWSLRVLFIERGELASLPDRFAARFLFRLFVRHNRLTSLPASLCDAPFLRELYVAHNKLTMLPEAIGNLRLLEELDAQSNELSTLPASLSRLESLRLLRLDRNQLTSLEALVGVTNLQELFVKSNRLTALPSGITRLVNLKRIYACFNQIVAAPPHLHLLTALQNCSFSNNAVRAFPSTTATPDATELTLHAAAVAQASHFDEQQHALVSRGAAERARQLAREFHQQCRGLAARLAAVRCAARGASLVALARRASGAARFGEQPAAIADAGDRRPRRNAHSDAGPQRAVCAPAHAVSPDIVAGARRVVQRARRPIV
jgi:Leucine-rich repeat (LRR) protein